MKSAAFIQTPTPDIEKSRSFYTKLGFKTINHSSRTLLTDGKVVIEINGEKTARMGLVILTSDVDEMVAKLKVKVPVFKGKNGFIVVDPNGAKVYIQNADDLNVPESTEAFGNLGKFSGLSMETIDFERSKEFWELLGYSMTAGNVDQGWITLSADNGVDISLMRLESCPHLTPTPGLTYFNSGNNLHFIKKIKDADIPISEEITCFSKDGTVDNIIIHDPGSTGFFIFND